MNPPRGSGFAGRTVEVGNPDKPCAPVGKKHFPCNGRLDKPEYTDDKMKYRTGRHEVGRAEVFNLAVLRG